MRAPGTPRQLLREVLSNTRSRIIGTRDYSIKFAVIGRIEKLVDLTCRIIYNNASYQVSCITLKYNGIPALLIEGDIRLIRRAITINPKITDQQLKVSCADHVSKKTIYRYFQKSGI